MKQGKGYQNFVRECTGHSKHVLATTQEPTLQINAKRQNGCLRRCYKWLRKEEMLKAKGKKERYTHLHTDFQRIARRDQKAFLSDQCKEIEENNRMGKTRDLFKKSRDITGTFLSKMGTIKDRNGIDLREAKDIKKR